MTKARLAAICLLLFSTCHILGVEPEKKVLNTQRVAESPKVDGILDDVAWSLVKPATDFIQNRPNPGQRASQRSEVRIVYDDDAIYVGAMLYDESPDSILNQLTNRDEIGNSDYFGVWFSCFQDGINAFEFITTPAGVQFDALISTFGEDTNWNAVWQCNTSITDKGWIAEMKIPYSAIRFPDNENQVWDVNVFRTIRRYREQSFWQHVDPELPGFVQQSGELLGVENITAPPRLFFYPYASAYLQVETTDDNELATGQSYNGGMDVKFGINDAFTLDMTLIPDFGQVQSDNQVLNLGPFEVRFNERRQFFTEGTELFNKGELFYSRRIGGTPINLGRTWDNLGENEVVYDYTTTTQLLNASKVSGRNKNGLGIGVFNAVTGREYATVGDTLTGETRNVETSPLVNYNIVVFDQNLPNNSFVSLVNTNVLRDGETYDANVTGTTFSLKNKPNSIEISGDATYNKKFNWGDDESDDGYSYNIDLSKISGNFLFGGGQGVESKYFDKNDLGFIYNPNEFYAYTWASWNIYEPFGKFNNLWSNFNINYGMLHEPREFSGFGFNGNVGLNTRDFFTMNFFFNGSPVNGRDWFGPRVEGRYFAEPKHLNFGFWVSSDYRKRLAFDASMSFTEREVDSWNSFNWRVEPRFRVNDQLMLVYVYSFQSSVNQQGWAAHDDENDDIIYATRDVITHTNVLTADYIFNNRMGLTFRLRHYWSFVDNSSFHSLDNDGHLAQTDFQGFYDDGTSPYDQSFNAFNIDMVYKWVFAPGSELSIVWKNSILDNDEILPDTWTDNFDRALGLPQVNSFSIRLLYFVDYLTFARKEKMIEN